MKTKLISTLFNIEQNRDVGLWYGRYENAIARIDWDDLELLAGIDRLTAELTERMTDLHPRSPEHHSYPVDDATPRRRRS